MSRGLIPALLCAVLCVVACDNNDSDVNNPTPDDDATQDTTVDAPVDSSDASGDLTPATDSTVDSRDEAPDSMDEADEVDEVADSTGQASGAQVSIKVTNSGAAPLFYDGNVSTLAHIKRQGQDQRLILKEPSCNCLDDTTACRPQPTLPVAAYVLPGEEALSTWDGEHWVPKAGQENCHVKTYAQPGEQYVAELCFGPTYALDLSAPFIEEPCNAQPFTFEDAAQVVEDYAPTPLQDATAVTVTIVNNSKQRIDSFLHSRCGEATIRVKYADSALQEVIAYERTQCSGLIEDCQTGMICPPLQTPCPRPGGLDVGESTTLSWNGGAGLLYPLVGMDQCALDHTAPKGPAQIEVCSPSGCAQADYTVGSGVNAVTVTFDP